MLFQFSNLLLSGLKLVQQRFLLAGFADLFFSSAMSLAADVCCGLRALFIGTTTVSAQ